LIVFFDRFSQMRHKVISFLKAIQMLFVKFKHKYRIFPTARA
jgi:hypothetical protein